MKSSGFSATTCNYWAFPLQPLRQKSEIFATSPYTGEALAASLTVSKGRKGFFLCALLLPMSWVEADGPAFGLLAGHQLGAAGAGLAALYPLPDGVKIAQPLLDLLVGHRAFSPRFRRGL